MYTMTPYNELYPNYWKKKTHRVLTFTHTQHSLWLDLWVLGPESTIMDFLAVHCQALLHSVFSILLPTSLQVQSTAQRKRKKTPIHIVWKTKQPVLNAAPVSAPPQTQRKRGSPENILGKTNTIEAGVKSAIINFYTKS